MLYNNVNNRFLDKVNDRVVETYYPVFPPAHNGTYVKTTSVFGSTSAYLGYYATDPSLSKIGTWSYTNWLSVSGTYTNQRFHIDLGSTCIIDRIYYENTHHNGNYTDRAAKNFTLWGSNSATSFANLTYATNTGWTQITGLSQTYFDKHVAADVPDPKYITISGNTTAYRYYAFKIADNWSGANYMGLRHIELQTSYKHGNYTSPSIGNVVDKNTRKNTAEIQPIMRRMVDNGLMTNLYSWVNSSMAQMTQGIIYPPAVSGDYIKATTKFSTDYEPYFVMEYTYPKSWICKNGVYTNQRLHIDLGSAKIITGFVYLNFRTTDAVEPRGVKDFTLQGSNSSTSFNALTYATDTGWTGINTYYNGASIGSFVTYSTHGMNGRYIQCTDNNTAYRYYAFKFANNHVGSTYIGLSQLALISDGGGFERLYDLSGNGNDAKNHDMFYRPLLNQDDDMQFTYRYNTDLSQVERQSYLDMGTLGDFGSKASKSSYSMWIKTNQKTVFGFGGRNVDSSCEIYIYCNSTLGFFGGPSTQEGSIAVSLDGSSSFSGYVNTNTGFNDGHLKHIVVVVNNTDKYINVYVNGIKYECTLKYNNTITLSDYDDGTFTLGAINSGGSIVNPFDGVVRDFRMWSDRCLTDDEVDILYKDYYQVSFTGIYPPAHNSTYVKATTTYDTSREAYFATDPAKPLDGIYINNSWMSANNQPTNQRFHIDLDSAKVINKIYYENFHTSGTTTQYGVKNFTLWGSNSATSFANLTYTTDTAWTQITGLSQTYFDRHMEPNQRDPKYITIEGNTTAYRYYAFKIADNWGGPAMGIRRLVLGY